VAGKKISRRQWIANSTAALGAAALPLAAFPESAKAEPQAANTQQVSSGQVLPPSPLQPETAADGQHLYQGTHRADWMQNPRYAWGVMTHYLADWQSQVHNLDMNVDLWNKMIDGWDVEGMARRLESVGAGHYQISIGQNSGYYLSPNPTYDKITGITPTKCSHRDLVADFYEPLRRRDIKLMVYLPSGAPDGDKAAMVALEWQNGGYPNQNFQRKWEMIIREWSQRWATKVAGWWLDGVVYPNSMYRSPEPPNFTSLGAAARAGNPGACVAFNPGVYNRLYGVTPDEDFTAGEIDDPTVAAVKHNVAGRVDGTQIHMLCFLGNHWGKGEPRFTTDQVVAYTKKVRDWGGSVTWDVPVELDGTITQPFMDQLAALGKAFPRGQA